MPERPRFLIVDGHSVIFAWPELRALHARKTATAREQLVKTLAEYQDYSGVRVVAVFDGKGAEPTEEERLPGGIQIYYSAAGQTADTIIERLVALYADKCDITVATSDHLEQETVHALGAIWVSSEQLRPMLDEAAREFSRRLDQHRAT